jgi:hypothetical protein
MDHYAVLGVSSDSSLEEIDGQYRVLKRLYQVDDDSGDVDRVNQRLGEIEAAYAALSKLAPAVKPAAVVTPETPEPFRFAEAPTAAAASASPTAPPSAPDYMPPAHPSASNMSRRLPAYVLLFVVLAGMLAFAIRHGFEASAARDQASVSAPSR